jgi:hypothetical protein
VEGRGKTTVWVAGAAVAAALVLVLLSAGAGRARTVTAGSPGAARATSAEATTCPAPTTVVLGDVKVRKGRTTVIRYRCDHEAGGAVVAELLVSDRSGTVVRTLVRGRTVPAGLAQTWKGEVTLAPGRYVVTAHARDAAGVTESRAVPAGLVVLRPLPPAVPAESGRRAAFAWAARRAGRVAVAVVDSRGRLYGYHADEGFMSASVVKAMLLVAYLRGHDTVSAAMRDVLQRMIEHSDNDAADVVYGTVGRDGLERLAKLAGMKGFRTTGEWITTRITAADMARFFRDMHRWLPSRHRSFADRLLSRVTPYQCWGIPAAARPLGYRVYFKPGWLGAWVLAHQAARLERGDLRLGLAVLTDDNPSEGYGKDTVAGVTARLLHE